jgi:hypothetical protein
LILLVLGVAAASFHAPLGQWMRSLLPRTATVRLIDGEDQTIPLVGRADVFELDRTLYLPSPRPLLGSIELRGDSEVLVLDSERFPKSLQVRFHVAGYGADFISVELGRRREFRLRLGPPIEVRGLVLDGHGGPLPGARVIALGIHARGVVLAEASSGADGRFVLTGISDRVGTMVLRVLKDGYSLMEREHVLQEFAIDAVRNTEFKLKPVPPVSGHISAPPGCDLSGVRVSVMNLPGVCTGVRSDGRFTLHHLEVGPRYRLLLRRLPAGFSQSEALCRAGERVEVQVMPVVDLQGTVISKESGRGVAAAKISHTNTTRGRVLATTDQLGRFVFTQVPVGELPVWIEVPASMRSPAVVEEHTIKVAAGAAGAVLVEVR